MTAVAAEYVELPTCDAVMVQVPGATMVAVVPETVQTPAVLDAKLTVKPEVAVALSGIVPPEV